MIHLGDGPAGLASLEPGSVDLVLTDPPSGDTAAPFDKPCDLAVFWPGVWHALKPTGVAVVMASGLRFAMALVSASLKEYRYDLVWRKNYPTGFLNAKKRPLRNHEFVLVFWRRAGTYNVQMRPGHVPISANRARDDGSYKTGSGNYGGQSKSVPSRAGQTSRFPVSVLEHKGLSSHAVDRVHPQQKPEGLLANLVLTYSNPGELVADPYSGSGSCMRAATTEGRRFVGWDDCPKFVEVANGRQGLFGTAMKKATNA